MSLRIYGATSGYVDLDAPAVAGSASVTLPGSGTLALYSQLKVLQVVSVTKSDTFTTTSSSMVDITGLSVAITPVLATSKILVLVNIGAVGSTTAPTVAFQIVRDSTAVGIGDAAGSRPRVTFRVLVPNATHASPGSFAYLDSPATTSATTYKLQCATHDTSTIYINRAGTDTDTNLVQASRTASTITVMEVLA